MPDPALQPTPRSERAPRLLVPQRNQIELRPVDLEATLAPEHPARNVWVFVEGLDLSALYTDIGSVEGHAGRAAINPRILMALWLYATIDGVGSAREIERLTQSHDAYRWICGGVNVNHHTLSDFRCARLEVLEGLLTHSVAVLLEQGLVQARSGGAGRDAGAGGRRSGLVPAPLDFGGLPGGSRAADRSVARGVGCRSAGQSTASPSGATARGRATHPAGEPSVAATCRHRAAEEEAATEEGHRDRGGARQAYRGARLQYRSRGADHEDGRRGLSPGLQRPVCHHHG